MIHKPVFEPEDIHENSKISVSFNNDYGTTAKKFLSKSKKSNLRSLLPPIERPQAKRTVMSKEDTEIDHINEKKDNSDRKKSKSIKNINNQSHIEKKKHEQTDLVFSIKNELKDVLSLNTLRRYEKISEILSYIYNEFPKSDKNKNRAEHKAKVYRDWELIEIQSNYDDTNLGDFLVKMLNPDNLPEDYVKGKKIDNKTNVSFLESMERYDQVFNTDTEIDKSLDECEKQAFEVAFYLLCFKKSKSRVSKSKEEITVEEFIVIFSYFKEIVHLSYSQYLEEKKKIDFRERENLISKELPLNYLPREDKNEKINMLDKNELERQFSKFKSEIYKKMRVKLALDTEPIKGSSPNILSYSLFYSSLFGNIPSLSNLLKLFPELLKKIFNEISKGFKSECKGKERIERKLALGGYLSKVSHEGELKWILSENRPHDFLTLMRKFIVYRLTRRGGFFIRSFLSKEETHIFLVIKASEEHLEKMAQMRNFNMEIELGSVDIFSFEPVDKYGRPLRCSKYVRELGFIRKYNLANNKEDRDETLGEKSIESESLNLYVKAMKMNKDELRAKIILDQEECDSCFNWLSSKTGCRFLQPDEILNNDFNDEEVENNIWPVYYVYNKMIIEYVSKLRTQFNMEKGNKIMYENLNNNLGLILRLMFLKALNVCNDMYLKHRDSRFRVLKNLFFREHPLQTIWNEMGEDVPRGYYPYFYSEKMEKIWRKFEINEEKERSKFSPADRLINTNEIIREYLNISKSIISEEVTDFYPIHDPYVLKNINVRPYLNVLISLVENQGEIVTKPIQSISLQNDNFVEYECEYTKEDFAKESMQEKLSFKCLKMTEFEVNSVAFYCGEKIAFFFEFRRYLTESAWPLSIITFIIQIIFWVENTHVVLNGSSRLTGFNSAMMIILVFINTVWVERTINGWENREKNLARSFGTNDMKESSKKTKRVLFEGTMERNMETDEINDEKAHEGFSVIKNMISFLTSLIFTVLMAGTILLIFALKVHLLQSNASQSTVTWVPSILISLSIIFYNYAYSKIIKILVDYENKKTTIEYEYSLTYKSFIVTFIVTYFALFIYTFFSQYFDGDTICEIELGTGETLNNCYYYISSQIVISAATDLLFLIAMSFVPLVAFYWKKKMTEKRENSNVSFNLNYFESIDCFYEEQDKMQTYMYTDEIDRTWFGYTEIVISFTTLILFAPIVPFLYSMIFVSGVISLNAKKYEIIYFSRRTLPIKVNSIGNWITIVRVMSVIGVFTNCALLIYIRGIFGVNKPIAFFASVFVILVLKYLLSFSSKDEDEVGKRCKAKTDELVSEKGYFSLNKNNEMINTDIENLYYDESKLKRKLPNLKSDNVKYK